MNSFYFLFLHFESRLCNFISTFWICSSIEVSSIIMTWSQLSKSDRHFHGTSSYLSIIRLMYNDDIISVIHLTTCEKFDMFERRDDDLFDHKCSWKLGSSVLLAGQHIDLYSFLHPLQKSHYEPTHTQMRFESAATSKLSFEIEVEASSLGSLPQFNDQ